MADKAFNDASFQSYLKEKKLMGCKCKKCGAMYFPPRPICIKCNSSDMEWVESKGNGKIVAFSVIPYGPMPMVFDGYGRNNPYCSGIVELEEGSRIAGQITGVDIAHPENIKIGTKVKMDFAERSSWHYVEDCYKIKRTALIFKAE